MKFAEMAQEVQMCQPTASKVSLSYKIISAVKV
jgi:hypothetical protein